MKKLNTENGIVSVCLLIGITLLVRLCSEERWEREAKIYSSCLLEKGKDECSELAPTKKPCKEAEPVKL